MPRTALADPYVWQMAGFEVDPAEFDDIEIPDEDLDPPDLDNNQVEGDES